MQSKYDAMVARTEQAEQAAEHHEQKAEFYQARTKTLLAATAGATATSVVAEGKRPGFQNGL